MDDAHLFNIFKILIKNIRNRDDAAELYKIYSAKVSNKYKYMMKSMINNIHIHKVLSFDKFNGILNSLNKMKYREECRKYIKDIFNHTDDEIQQLSIMRIIETKNPKNTNGIALNDKKRKSKKKRSKKCPHCDKVCTLYEDDTYVICGYGNKGYDWDGCTRDWCFRCGKKLCKSWDKNQLFNTNNRYHNSCCKLSAIKNKESISNYCSCSKAHVEHKI